MKTSTGSRCLLPLLAVLVLVAGVVALLQKQVERLGGAAIFPDRKSA